MNCYVCKNKSGDTSYHAFPNEPQLRTKWLDAFGFNEMDINNNTKICGDHFDDTCFVHVQGEDLKIKKMLLEGSVPSVQLNYHYSRRKPNNDALHGTNISITDVSSNVAKVNNIIKVKNAASVPLFNLRDVMDTQNKEIVDASSDEPLSDDDICAESEPVCDNGQPKAKQNRWRPAYVSQIDLEHGFDNPVLAKRHFQMAKDRIAMLEKKVRKISRKVRRLENKSEQQKSTLKLLKEDSSISKPIKINVEASTSETLKEVLSRHLEYKTKKYSPKLHEFAMNLHFCSPKAYKYVRTHLENVLPHATTIAKWYRVIDGNPRPIKKIASRAVLNQSQNEITDNCTIDEMDVEEDGNMDSSLEKDYSGEITEKEQST